MSRNYGVTNMGDIPSRDDILASTKELQEVYGTIVGAAGNADLKRGAVLGKITLGAATVAADGAGAEGANTGDGTLTMDATTPVKSDAKVGVYSVKCTKAATNGGTFQVKDPDGFEIGEAVVGTAFDNDIKFTIADGSSDFIVGDGFTVTVAAGSGKYTLHSASAKDGSQVIAAILAEDTAAPAGTDEYAPLYTKGEFLKSKLTAASGTTLVAGLYAYNNINIVEGN